MSSSGQSSPLHPARDRGDEGLLANRNFILLWCAYGVSAIGDHLSEIAILKTRNAVDPTVNVTAIDAQMTFLFFVPFFLLGPLTGWLSDRLPRRSVMVTADLARMMIMLSFTGLMALTGDWGSWGPMMPLLLLGVFAAMFSPARASLLPTLIRPDQLVRANGMMGGLGIIATMIAILIGGYLAQHYAPTTAFRWDALTYLLSAALLVCIRMPLSTALDKKRTRRPIVREVLDGFRYTRTHKAVYELLLIAALVWFCGSLVKCAIPAIVRDVYGGEYQQISYYRGYLGAGLILGAILISTTGNALRSEIAITWGLMGIAAGVAFFAASVFLPFSPVALSRIGAAGLVVAGTFGIVVMASFNALLQRVVPDRYRGRVFGVMDVVCIGALLLATGLLAFPQHIRIDRWVGYIIVGVAVLALVGGCITLSVRLHRGRYGRILTFAQHLNEFVCRLWWRFERIGPCTVPREGPVILTANHVCAADPLLLSTGALPRAISFLVAAEYANLPVVRFVLQLVECIPVKRDGRDTGSTKQAIRHLRRGKAVGIFIEGRIMLPGETARPKDGVSMLALKTGAKVIPAYISGVRRTNSILPGLFARHHARVRFGPPVDLSEFQDRHAGREAVHAATRKIYQAINSLVPEHDQHDDTPTDEDMS